MKLYYIKGINRTDTIDFKTIEEQEEYFNNHIVQNIYDAYYPPYFNNTIRLSIEDLSLSTQVNYLSLEFNSKEYYYFIDNLNYINESLFEIFITMDTIQTYMFNIDFLNAKINRMSIERYNNDNTINRLYDRENHSSDTKVIYNIDKPINHGEFKRGEHIPFYLVFSTKSISVAGISILGNGTGTTLTYANTTLNYNNSNIPTQQYCYIVPCLPLIYEDVPTSYKWCLNNEIISNQDILCTLEYTIEEITKNPYVTQILYITNFQETFSLTINDIVLVNGFYEVRININYSTFSNDINKLTNINLTMVKIKEGNYGYECLNLTNISASKSYIDNINVYNFKINKSVYTLFNSKYVPYMLDENYIDFNFGEMTGFSKYPLSKLKNSNLYGFKSTDLLSGSRGYYLTDTMYRDNYKTQILCNSVENLTVFNDKYQEYLVTNKGSLTTGLAAAYNNLAIDTAKSTISSITNLGISGLNDKISSGGINGLINAPIDYFQKSYNIEQKIKEQKENAYYTPNTIKHGNSFSSDTLFLSLDLWKITYIDLHFEEIAKLIEQIGYKVGIIIDNENLFNYCRKRFYYNVISTEDLSIDLINCLSSNSVINLLKERFSNGIRLWNKDYEIGSTYIYDNVENKYIESED